MDKQTQHRSGQNYYKTLRIAHTLLYIASREHIMDTNRSGTDLHPMPTAPQQIIKGKSRQPRPSKPHHHQERRGPSPPTLTPTARVSHTHTTNHTRSESGKAFVKSPLYPIVPIAGRGRGGQDGKYPYV